MTSSMNGYTGMQGPAGQGNKIPKGQKLGQIQNFTPEQMQLFGNMFKQTDQNSNLSRLAAGDQGMFDEMEAPAFRQFNELQGNMASRFSQGGGQGSLGGRKSSGFQNAMSQAGSSFAQDLASKRQGLQRQAIMDLHGISKDLLQQRPYENFMYDKPNKNSTAWGLGGAAVGGVGGFLMGGPMGALTGAKMGYDLGSGGSTNQQFKSSGNKDWLYEGANYFDPGI